MQTCLSAPYDEDTLADRVKAFVEDRSVSTVTGPRRYGRSELVRQVSRAAFLSGMNVWTATTGTGVPDMMVLDHWSELEEALKRLEPYPGTDVVYGQDLCHQVPAVVRFDG